MPAQNLKTVLQDTYRFYLTAHHYHWNVEGSQFVTLHKLFEDQYQDAFEALDDIAERIRALDVYVHLDIGNGVDTQVDGDSAEERAEAMVKNLIKLNQELVVSFKVALDNVEKSDDPVTEDLFIGRMDVHSKSLWILKSLLKK